MIQLWFIGLLLAATVVVGAAGIGYKHGRESGTQEIQTAWDAERAQAAIKSQELQANMDKLREGKNRELARLNHTVNALSDSLRSRPERPTGEASSAGDGAPGCTGAELYRPDGEFLVGESARADQLRLALMACQSAYQSAYQSAAGK